MTPTPSEQAAAVLSLVDSGVIEWDDPEVVTVFRNALKYNIQRSNRLQKSGEPLKSYQIAPSGRMTKAERNLLSRIRCELAQHCIKPQRWEIEALARGATMIFGELKFKYSVAAKVEF